MSNKSIISSFWPLLSQKIAEVEKIFGTKDFKPHYVEILVIDNLPNKKEVGELENDLLNNLIIQGWKIAYFKIVLEKPARITISFQISPQ